MVALVYVKKSVVRLLSGGEYVGYLGYRNQLVRRQRDARIFDRLPRCDARVGLDGRTYSAEIWSTNALPAEEPRTA